MHNRPMLIILAAVVALIVIVVVTGMRYLRADDDYELDDEVQAKPSRPRNRSGQLSDDRDRSARRDQPAARRRDDTGAGAGARRSPERAGTGPGSPRRGEPAGRPERSRSERIRPEPDSGELVMASSRFPRSADGRESGRGPRGGDGRPGRASGSGAGQAGTGERGDWGPRGGGAGERAGRADEPRNGRSQPRQDERLPAVRPRPSRGKRDDDGEWPSSEWDQLSDVDYWAELASDKPLTTTAQPGSESRPGRPQPQRPEPRRETAPGLARGPRAEHDRDARLPSRRERRPEPALPAAAGPRDDQGLPIRTAQVRSNGHRRPERMDRPAAEDIGPAPRSLPDDDPLTSPSFPRIAVSDSRSYRRDRSEPEPAAAYQASMPPVTGPVSYTSGDWTIPVSSGYPVPDPLQEAMLPAPTSAGYQAPGDSGSHRMPAATGGYAAPSGPIGYQADAGTASYPAQAGGTAGYPVPPPAPAYAPDASYPAYGAPGPTGYAESGRHARVPEPYLPPGYGPLPGSQVPAAAPGYSGPFTGGHSGTYALPPVAPVGPAGQVDPRYYPSPYDPPDYAGADPYAMDPYAFPGYTDIR